MHAVIAEALRGGTLLQDLAFDQVFPASQRFRSWLHWTPVEVALRAVALLAPRSVRRVLDVGSGVGKLCLVGAATTQAEWFGIERDGEMVRAANYAAGKLHLADRACFVHGDITSIDWATFDAFYLFNPFAEILLAGDEDALARRDRYGDNIDFVQNQLAQAATGTRVVTYHGFGGEMPPGFDRVHREGAREDELCLWVRRRPRARTTVAG